MKTENVKQIIQGLFRENFYMYPETYPLNADGTATDEASEYVADVARAYFYERNEMEIERDADLGVTEIDYVEWCMAEFSNLIDSALID